MMEEVDDETIQSNNSGDPACDVVVVGGGDKNIVEVESNEGKCIGLDSFHDDSDNTEGFVDDQAELLYKEAYCNHYDLVKACNVDETMATPFPAEDNIQSKQLNDTVSHDVDLSLFNISHDEGLVSSNKSAESLIYHSAESTQYHSAESAQMETEQLDVDIKDKHNDLFNIGVQITVDNKTITPEDFNNDISSSSEALNAEKDNGVSDEVNLNGTNSGPAVTVTTLCEAILKENGVNPCKISELSSEESDAVVMKTFLISSDEYDATVTTMLEISSLNTIDTASKPCDMSHDEHSVVKTFEISSPKYDATITTTVEEITLPGSTAKQFDISSHNVDDVAETDEDGDKNKINFQISCADGDIKNISSNEFIDNEDTSCIDNANVVLEDEQCVENTSVPPTLVSSLDDDVSIDKTLGFPSIGTDEYDLETAEVSFETDASKAEVSFETDSSNITSVSLSPIKQSFEELSYNSNFDTMIDDPSLHNTLSEKDTNTKSYDILSQEECITTDIPNDQLVDASSVDILPSLRTSFEHSDHKIEATSSFETDITVQTVDNVLAEPNDNIEIDAISSLECIDTSEVQCDISPRELSGSVDAAYDEQKYGGLSKAVIESQKSAASSNKSFEILSFDSDSNVVNRSDDKLFSDNIDEADKVDFDIEKNDEAEGEENIVNICDDGDIATGDLQKISSFSSTEADVIIDKTFDALSNEINMAPESTIESETSYDILSIGAKKSEVIASKDESILKINEFSQHKAGAIIDKTFEDLSNEGVKLSLDAESNTPEKAYDILSFDAKVPDKIECVSDGITLNGRNGSIQSIGDFSDHEAGAIIEKTFEDLSNEAADVVSDISVASIRSDSSEKAFDILSVDAQIPEIIDAPTDVTPDEYFAHLSIETDVATQQPILVSDECDMNSDKDIKVLPTETDESILKINEFSAHEAGVIIDKTFDDISSETIQDTNKDSVLPIESNTEVTYHILSIENGNSNEEDEDNNVAKLFEKSNVNTDETFEHLNNESKNHTNNIEIIVNEEDNDIYNTSSDEVIETLEGISHEPYHNIGDRPVLPKDLDIPEKTYDIYSFDDGAPKDHNITTVLKIPDESNLPTDDTFEHLANGPNEIDNKNEELKIPDTTDQNVNNGKCDETDEFLDIVDEETVDLVNTKDTAVTHNEKTLAEIAEIYDKAYPVEGITTDDKNIHIDNVQHEVIGFQREGSQFEIIEGRSFGILNNHTVDIGEKEDITPPIEILIDKTLENNNFINVDVDNTHLKTQQPKIIAIDKTNLIPITPSNVETIKNIKNQTNGHDTGSTVMSGKQENTDAEIIKHQKDVNIKRIHISSLADYDVIDHDEVNSVVIPESYLPPKFSFALFSLKIKKAFSPSSDWKSKQEFFNEPVYDGSKEVSINVEDKITSDGEEIQVLTFSRNADKSGVKFEKSKSADYQDGRVDSDNEGHGEEVFFNPDVTDDGSITDGGVKKRVELFENNVEKEAFNCAPVVTNHTQTVMKARY